MKLGYIGLGKMGAGMVELLLENKHSVSVYDINQKTVAKLVKKGAKGASNVKELVYSQKSPRIIWIMVPYKFVDGVLKEIKPHLNKGDIVVDGGNSPYQDSVKRFKLLAKEGVNYLDVGVSGGPSGARNGACMMIGGKKAVYTKLEKLFKDLCVKDGYGYMGESGAGHFVKMIHNGIEYGMMQSIAEGFDLLKNNKQFKLNLKNVTKVYSHGSVIESSLISWLADGYNKFGIDLTKVSGSAVGSGEGLWTVNLAKKLKIPAKVIDDALKARNVTQYKPSYQGKVVMTMRNQFGGHDINPKK